MNTTKNSSKNKKSFSRCRRCKKKVDKNATMFGYCHQCMVDLGADLISIY